MPDEAWLVELVQLGLVPEVTDTDFDSLPVGSHLRLVEYGRLPDPADVRPIGRNVLRDPGGGGGGGGGGVAGGIAIGALGSAVWDGVKSVAGVLTHGSGHPGVYNPPANPMPPVGTRHGEFESR